MAENHHWPIECLDFAGRPRSLDLIAVPRFVILKAPPGESAYLSFAAIEPLRANLLDAMVKASRLS